MNEERLNGYVITYKNAADGTFHSAAYRNTLRGAKHSSRMNILLDYARYDLKLNAEIHSELHPEEPAIIITLDSILNKYADEQKES